MKVVTSLIYECNSLNIISPTAHGLIESEPLTSIYPTLDEWNNTLRGCLQSESSIDDHCKLHGFLLKWNTALDPGWLRVLLSRGQYKENLVGNDFYKACLNTGEKILILLLLVLLQDHEFLLPIKLRQRVDHLANAFKKTYQGISKLLKKQPIDKKIKLHNLRQLLLQSLLWRNNFTNNKAETDPLYLFVYEREYDWMACQIKEIEAEASNDLELSNWMTKKCIAPLLRYLVVTKHNGHISEDILKKMGLCLSYRPRCSAAAVVDITPLALGEFSLKPKDHNPAIIIDDSIIEGEDETSVKNLFLPEDVVILNEYFTNEEHLQKKHMYDSTTEGGNGALDISFTSSKGKVLLNQSFSNDEHMQNKKINDSNSEGIHKSSVKSFILPDEVILFNKSFPNDENKQENQINTTEGYNEASAKTFASSKEEVLLNHSFINDCLSKADEFNGAITEEEVATSLTDYEHTPANQINGSTTNGEKEASAKSFVSSEHSLLINSFFTTDNHTKVTQAKRGGFKCFRNIEEHKRALQILTSAVQREEGWKSAVVLADIPEFLEMITVDQALKLHKQLTMLKHAVCLLLEHPEKNWCNVLEDTTQYFCYENMGPRTLRRTFDRFKKHKFKLPHPNSREVDSMGKKYRVKADHFLETYPDLKLKFLSFSRENLRRFSVDMMHNFANTELMPRLKNEIQCALQEKEGIAQSTADEENKINAIIKREYGFCNGSVSRTTVFTWIRKLDFTYGIRKKGYFNDKHEEQKDQRQEYILKRFEDEIQQPVWVQKTTNEFMNLQNNGTLSESLQGFPYQDTDGTEMIEFHVDSDKGDTLLKELDKALYGGFFSVRRQNLPQVIVFGHDEAIMKQNQFSPCAWSMGDGTAVLIPKTEGAGVMYSLFVSRPTGIGFGTFWTEEVQLKVNMRRQGQKYFDEEAAIEVLGKSEKEPLLADPANRKFIYGGNNGWWTGNHVVIQVEDCLDAFFEIFPNIHPCFLFDNSTGHSKGRKNGLNVNNMNKLFGGKQELLHPSVITEQCLGPFSPKLQPGDEQTFSFQEGDEGPFYLTALEKEQRKVDTNTGKQRTRNLTIAELKRKLQEKGVNFFGKKLRRDLVDLATIHGISEKSTSDIVLEGWMGKAKGMLQIAWERGLIDPARASDYQVDAPLDVFGVEVKTLSLREILASCEDFLNEKSQLQYVIESLGGSCQMSPKYHPEIAGEGIENLWGYIKKLYRTDWSIREAKDQKEVDFQRLIDGIMDGSDGRLNAIVVRKAARRARNYMIAYSLIQKKQEQQTFGEEEAQQNEAEYETIWGPDKISVSYALIEKVVRQLRNKKSHRAPRDLDTAFINAL